MAIVKTAISLQESLFQQAEALAHDLHVSRSRLFSLAMERFIQQHENRKLFDSLNAAYEDKEPDLEEERVLRGIHAKQRKLIEEESW